MSLHDFESLSLDVLLCFFSLEPYQTTELSLALISRLDPFLGQNIGVDNYFYFYSFTVAQHLRMRDERVSLLKAIKWKK